MMSEHSIDLKIETDADILVSVGPKPESAHKLLAGTGAILSLVRDRPFALHDGRTIFIKSQESEE